MNIDWSESDQFPEMECYCRCHMDSLKHGDIVEPTFYSHTKLVTIDGRMRQITRKPCPRCGQSDNLARASSGPIRETISRDQIGKLRL